jgi:hypothetical protein
MIDEVGGAAAHIPDKGEIDHRAMIRAGTSTKRSARPACD